MGWTEYGKWQSTEGVSLLTECGIRSGMKILDFGSSIGEYSVPASIAVGEAGKVVAVDKNIHRVKTLRETCTNWNITNLQVIKGNEDNGDIQNSMYDCVLYFDMYHAMGKDPQIRAAENQRILQRITQTLKPGGLLLVSVFSEMCLIWDEVNGERTPKGFLKAQRVTIEEGIRWFHMVESIEECGFVLQKKVPGTVHFDEFYRRGEPDMETLERGNIFVFEKK